VESEAWNAVDDATRPPGQPEIAVLVLNYNGEQHLRECFRSLECLALPEHYRTRIICVDNHSTDGSMALLRAEFPSVEIMAFPENLYFTGAYNQAIRQVDSEFIVLLNNDTFVAQDWLVELAKALDASGDDVVIFGSKILHYDAHDRLAFAGGQFNVMGGGYPRGWGEPDSGQFQAGFVGLACGAAMLVRRSAYLGLGGFDPRYIAYFEDVDLCWRAWLAGLKVVYVPGSVIYHKVGSSFGARRSPVRITLSLKNRLATLVKNLELPGVIFGVLANLIFETYRVFFFLLHRDLPAIRAILAGLKGFFGELPGTLVSRRAIQGSRKIRDADLRRMQAFMPLPTALRALRKLGGA
jgi:GT2 family glycosyltransferase